MMLADPFNVRGAAPLTAAAGGWERLAATVPQTRLAPTDERGAPARSRGRYGMRAARIARAERAKHLAVLRSTIPDPAAWVAASLAIHDRLPSARMLAGRCAISVEKATAVLTAALARKSRG